MAFLDPDRAGSLPARSATRSAPEGPGRAVIVGTGLIGGSLGMALRARGWRVSGSDVLEGRAARARELGALDEVGFDDDADLVVIATQVSAIAAEASEALRRVQPGAVVTDVGGVKAPIVSAVDHPRFIGGHPMAGNELEGVDGADPELFEGATWVLTPTETTDAPSYTWLRAVWTSLGAEVVALPPARHDEMVAVVSHVPHLVAATLMGLAASGAEENRALLRLAAGGFRDMTRIASGHPGIWPDVCTENAPAILETLDGLLAALGAVRGLVADADRTGLLAVLDRARQARRNLPRRVKRPDELAELRVPVADRPGVLAEVTTLAGELGVNIADLEIAHSAEGDRGVLILLVDVEHVERLRKMLVERGLHPAALRLS